jgi:hypothetical protein
MIKLLKEYLSLLIETNLAPRHMYKDSRWETFLQKIEDEEYFEHVDGRRFKIEKSNVMLKDALKAKDIKQYKDAFRAGVSIIFEGEENENPKTLFYSGHIKKTAEFGGTNPFAGEQEQITSLGDSLRGVSSGRTIRVKYSRGNKSKLINGITKGIGKSDATLTFNGAPEIQVSLKNANSPNQMMQWSGLSRFLWHPEVKKFVTDVESMKGQLNQGFVYYRYFDDLTLKKDLCYGDNVDVIVIGDSNIQFLKVANDLYEIDGQRIFYREDEEIPDEEWDPCFVAFHTGDRNDFRIEGFRLVVWPVGKITNGRPI